MKKGIIIWIIMLVVVAIALIAFIFYYLGNVKENLPDKVNEEKGNLNTEKPDETINNVAEGGEIEKEVGIVGGGTGGNGAGGASGGSGDGETSGETEVQYPDDLNTMPCGHYSPDYKICTGFCPNGECVQEGRSCYCKIV